MRALNTSLDSASSRIGTFASTAGKFAMTGLAVGAGVATVAIAKCVAAASDLNETVSKTGVIFGPSADVIIAKAKEMAAAFGTNREEFINAATSFGAVFKGMGKSQEEAARLGNQLTQLGLDMASFDNASNAEVFTALQASLRGEFDPLERFRVFLSAAKIEAKALDMGLAKSKAEMTDYAKKMATLALITEQTADAQGDLARTADSPANQFRRLTGVIDNFKISIGEALMPAIQIGTSGLIEFTKGAISAFESVKEPVGFFAENIAAFVTNVNRSLAVLGQNMSAWGQWVANNWVTLLTDDFRRLGTAIQNLATGNWGDLAKGFEAKAPGPPPWLEADLITMDDLMAKRGKALGDTLRKSIWEQGEFSMQDFGQSVWDQGDFTPADLGKSIWDQGLFEEDLGSTISGISKTAEDRSPTLATKGSAEAAEAIARNRNKGLGNDPEKPLKEVAKNGKDQLGVQNRMASTLASIDSRLASSGSLSIYPITG